jgi:LPS sulfotransferase NodH
MKANLTPKISYFICTLPRSGSWLLCESLEQTRIAGRPREYFEPKLFQNGSEATYSGVVARIIRAGMTKNGVFGVKFHWYQFEHSPRIIAQDCDYKVSVPCLMAEKFPNLKYVWLTRRDKVRQAVSYFRASKTGQWWNIPGVNKSTDAPAVPKFDFDRIRYLENLVVNHEAKWQKYFEEHAIDPLVLVYEEVADDHRAAVLEVLSYLKVPYPKRTNFEPRLLRQADTLTEEWVERYFALKQMSSMRVPAMANRTR